MAEQPRFGVVAFLLLAAGLSALTLGYPGTADDGDFLHWASVLDDSGPFHGYAQIADYPPLGPFILWAATRAGGDFGLQPFTCIKLAIDAFQFCAALIIHQQMRSWAAAALVFLLISPFGALLGYIDAFYLPFVLIGIFALRYERFGIANLMFATATLIKWQPAVLCPIVLIYSLGRCRKPNVLWPVPAAFFAVLAIAIFGPNAVQAAFSGATNDSLFSGQAFNLDWIITFVLEATHSLGTHFSTTDTVKFINHLPLPWYAASRGLFWIVYIGNLIIFASHGKTWNTCVLALLSAETIQFTFNTGVHENHSFLIMILAFVASAAGVLPPLEVFIAAALAISNILAFYGLALVAGHAASVGTVVLSALDILMCFGFIHRHVMACREAGLVPILSRLRAV
jgi:hypothetical protein